MTRRNRRRMSPVNRAVAAMHKRCEFVWASKSPTAAVYRIGGSNHVKGACKRLWWSVSYLRMERAAG